MQTKLSTIRADILNRVKSGPQSARQIYSSIGNQTTLSTVYRALEHLETRGLVQSVSFIGGERYYYSREGHGHFLFCRECHEIVEFHHCALEKLQKEVEQEYQYSINSHILTFTGFCPDCGKSAEKKQKIKEGNKINDMQ